MELQELSWNNYPKLIHTSLYKTAAAIPPAIANANPGKEAAVVIAFDEDEDDVEDFVFVDTGSCIVTELVNRAVLAVDPLPDCVAVVAEPTTY
jgi:hypothetical protein